MTRRNAVKWQAARRNCRIYGANKNLSTVQCMTSKGPSAFECCVRVASEHLFSTQEWSVIKFRSSGFPQKYGTWRTDFWWLRLFLWRITKAKWNTTVVLGGTWLRSESELAYMINYCAGFIDTFLEKAEFSFPCCYITVMLFFSFCREMLNFAPIGTDGWVWNVLNCATVKFWSALVSQNVRCAVVSRGRSLLHSIQVKPSI